MRLLFVSNLFPDTVETYRGLDNSIILERLAAEGWTVRVVAPRPVPPWRGWGRRESGRTALARHAALAPVYPAARYVPRFGSAFNHLLLRAALRRALAPLWAEFRPDLVLGTWAFPDLVALAPLAKAAGVPWVGIVQGTDVHQYLRDPLRRRLIARHLPEARAVICRSAKLGTLLAGAGVPAGLLRPVYNGIDNGLFAPGPQAEARAALGWPAQGQLALYVGNFYPVKHPLLAVEAAARLPADGRLAMIGGGPLEPSARALADKLGAGGRVLFAGRRGAAEVAQAMRAADVLCIPSWNEGLPNVLLEALATGLPVVSTDVGGISEVLRAPDFGRLVPPGDAAALAAALAEVLAAPPARTAVAAYGQGFTWERCLDQYREILRVAAAQRP